MIEPNEIKEKDRTSSPSGMTGNATASPFALAGGLLWNDRLLLFPWYLLLVSPEVFGSIFDLGHPTALHLASGAFDLIFLWWMGKRHITRLSAGRRSYSPLSLILFFVIGSATSAVPSIPLIALSLGQSAAMQMVFLTAAMGTIFFAYFYFFWFFPFQAGVVSLRRALSIARHFITNDWKSPFKVMLAPAGIMLLGQGLLNMPAPDGRVIELAVLSDSLGGLYWVLSSYTGFAVALTMLSEREWHDLHLDSYRQSRMTTLAVASRPWLEKALTPSFGLQVFALCVLVWAANSIRLANLPPAPAIAVDGVELKESQLTLRLRLHDSKYRYYGFRPAFFRLAGSQRTVVSPFPEKAWIAGEDPEQQRLLGLPHDKDDVSLILEFRTSITASELSEAKDLYLWYGGIRLNVIPMEQTHLDRTSSQPQSGQRSFPAPESQAATPELSPTQS